MEKLAKRSYSLLFCLIDFTEKSFENYSQEIDFSSKASKTSSVWVEMTFYNLDFSLESSSNKNEMKKKFQRILVTLAVGSYSKFESYFLAIHIA